MPGVQRRNYGVQSMTIKSFYCVRMLPSKEADQGPKTKAFTCILPQSMAQSDLTLTDQGQYNNSGTKERGLRSQEKDGQKT